MLEGTAAGSATEQVESLISRLAPVEAFAAVEHLFGVRPLVDAFFARGSGVAPEGGLGALGLFTPTPALGWAAAAVEGEPTPGGLLLHGEIRTPNPDADAALILVRLATGEYRLAWLDYDAPGVEWRESRAGWHTLDGSRVGEDLMSPPLALADLYEPLEAYAALWALAAGLCAAEGVRALRRAARTTARRGTAFNTSQLLAMGITEVEIEAELALLAARQHRQIVVTDEPASGLALATAAARVLAAVAARTAELRDQMGLPVDGPFADERTARILMASFGGAAMLESELARALGIPAGEGHA